jgi:pyruvate dehydrogenase E2 component (dihydrolipoamide acetyltransferase)
VAQISGSGPHGRVVKKDVEAAIASGTGKAPASEAAPQAAASAAPAAAPPKGMSDDAVLKNFAEGSYELVKHDGMRKTIARRLQESKQTIPHFYVTVDCELDALLKLRSELNKAAPLKDDKPAYKLSVNDMVIKALALALRDVPDANVSWTDENMVMHKHSDVGVAVSIPGGLITPIIRSAELKTLSAISNEMKDLGKRAKDRKLKPEEYQGGTTCGLQHGHDGRQGLCGCHQPAACDHPGRWRRRAACSRQGRCAGGSNCHERDALDRSSLRGWCAWRGTACRVQGLHRKPDGDACLNL